MLRHRSQLATSVYANMTIKEKALARVQPRGTQPGCYGTPDSLLPFLDTLLPLPADPGLSRAHARTQHPDQHLHAPSGIIGESA